MSGLRIVQIQHVNSVSSAMLSSMILEMNRARAVVPGGGGGGVGCGWGGGVL